MDELLSRGVDQIVGRDELVEALTKKKRKLRIKFGVDPTRPDIHIGHAVPLRQLRQFQNLGHTVIFLIGDYTTKIGDPSGRNKTRPTLSDGEIAHNAKTYFDQVGKILDIKKAEIRYNSEWLSKVKFADLLQLASNMSVARLIDRDDFKNRLETGQELALHELLYPLMQAYDSVALEADMECGGTDQLFNLLTARALQKKLGQRPQIVFTSDLLVGLDGVKKMSKSLDNYIGITDKPLDMYGKVMSVPDTLIAPYYKLCTDIPLPAINELVKSLADGANPRDSKASLARQIVRRYHSDTLAEKAEVDWNRQFREGGRPANLPKYTLEPGRHQDLFDALVGAGLIATKLEGRRAMQQGGIKLNDETINSSDLSELKSGDVVQVGKRRYIELVVKK